jgi:hypothetical protein
VQVVRDRSAQLGDFDLLIVEGIHQVSCQILAAAALIALGYHPVIFPRPALTFGL